VRVRGEGAGEREEKNGFGELLTRGLTERRVWLDGERERETDRKRPTNNNNNKQCLKIISDGAGR